MNTTRRILLGTLAATLLCAVAIPAYAGFRRHYYGSWGYNTSYSYYYRPYYYYPSTTYTGAYHYHYCIHYPSQPRYVYYYNPYSSQYWGRYDLESQGYSLLAEKDRKANLKEIPESAFPKPGEMPAIPESEDGVKIPAPDKDDLPTTKADGLPADKK